MFESQFMSTTVRLSFIVACLVACGESSTAPHNSDSADFRLEVVPEGESSDALSQSPIDTMEEATTPDSTQT